MMNIWRMLIIVGLLGLPIAANAQVPNESAIQGVISSQLDAMNKDDNRAAFGYASPMIQGMFGDAETFMTMVQAGYPQVYHSSSHKFLKLEMIEGALIQRVLVEGHGGSVVARYEMIEIDGKWRINGCSFEPRGDA